MFHTTRSSPALMPVAIPAFLPGMPNGYTFAAAIPSSPSTPSALPGAVGRGPDLFTMAKREESFVLTYFGRAKKNEFEFPKKLPSTLHIEIPEKAIQSALESIERRCNITPSRGGLRCVAKSGNTYVMKHLCGAVVAADSDGLYRPEIYIPSHDLYLQDLTLYKAHPLAEKDGIRIIRVKGLGSFAFRIDEKGNAPGRIENADLTDLGFIAYMGRVYEARKADTPEIIESEGENTNPHFITDSGSGERLLFAVPKDGKTAPLTRRSYPSIALVTDKSGSMYDQPPVQIGETDFFISTIPEPSDYGEFKFDGSGDHRNIKIQKALPDGKWLEASQDEIRDLLQTRSYAQTNPAFLKTPTVRHPMPASSEIDEIGTNLVAERIFTQALNIFTPDFEKRITLQIEADERSSFLARRSRIVRMMAKSPIALFSNVERIEIYPKSSRYYGFNTVDVWGTFCSDGEVVRLFEFDREYGKSFSTFLHEMWHSLQGYEGSENWITAMLAIKAGGEKEFITINKLTDSYYHGRSWGEFIAQAGASITSGAASFEEFSEIMPFASALILSLAEKSAKPAGTFSTKQS